MRFQALAAMLLIAAPAARAQSTGEPAYLTTGIFIGAIEEGARIFTPVRLLPFAHPEALGHQFPTVQQLHHGEDGLLVLLGQHAGLRLKTTLQRSPVEPDTLWPFAPFQPPPAGVFQAVRPKMRLATKAPLPGLRAVAYLDGFPLAFIVDTRGMTLAQLKITQEVITLLVFAPFALVVMKQPLKLDFLWAGLCLVGAVYFVFRSR